MSNVTVFRLNQEVHFEPPRAWSVQARYAFVYNEGGPFAAAVSRLVIYLGPRRFFDGQGDRIEYLYRFSDGRVGVLDTPPDGRFTPVEPPPLAPGMTETLPPPDPAHMHQLRVIVLE